ncbi:MAG: YbaB/EbfC family nucleoid-associated protein [Helicobacter sp.]|uniref:YbaB/EbfC family nucleoid-associated protein n=1 Tax=Helicobacter sp. 10-6591 TaxID=2004998 RepID=UPI000DCBFBF1|nr:YbaB/EbfC family nucleoid-associated protein [Helicobacter sp. 10-6591]MCI6217284.1 YbaB/EbfC family nucleoid-associated protein [Helicobacter sp.]MCI7484554.1 YbaB/EbfC family nucleoid-associated protein [Helicobacter sp.]MDD7566984.1 YbaB/EbfC family nucleoid-associated protein [Helicobacter sp.]MDY5741197.1 YbaB/EbfC family nucleoid-associated protein [Helicobacter sp.]RAX54791.1 nucleoid-associated protein, YbaB/EbfC family [Helicobacter sp. 10-6591]
MFDPKQLGDIFANMQESLKQMNEKNKDTLFTAKSGGGLVEVSFNGAGEIVDLNIDESLLEDRDSLQILLLGALNDAYKNMEQNKQSNALNMLGDLNLFPKN